MRVLVRRARKSCTQTQVDNMPAWASNNARALRGFSLQGVVVFE